MLNPLRFVKELIYFPHFLLLLLLNLPFPFDVCELPECFSHQRMTGKGTFL